MNGRHDRESDQSIFGRLAWARSLGGFDDEVGGRLLDLSDHGVMDDVVRGLIEPRIRSLEAKEKAGILPPFKPTRASKGEILLGRDLLGYPARLPLQALRSHALIVGSSGSGKTTLLKCIVMQLLLRRCPFWLVDSYKKDLRGIAGAAAQMGSNVVVLRPHDWKFNLLQADGIDPRLHLGIAVDILARATDQPSRARIILNQKCHQLYGRFGIWTGRTERWPTPFDLFESIRVDSGLNVAAKEALLDRLGSVLVSLTPRCAAYRTGWTASQLARHSIVFEMRGGAETVKGLLMEPLLHSLFQAEVQRGALNQALNLFVGLDDPQRYLDTGGAGASGEFLLLDELAGILRGTGKGLGFFPQSTVGLSRKLIPNLATKIAGRLGCAEDLAFVQANFGLTADQLAWVRLNLRPGLFVALLGEGESREPFVFEAPLIETGGDFSDADVAASQRELDSLPTVFADEYAAWEPVPSIEVSSAPAAGHPSEPPLAEADRRYLEALVAEPGKSAAYYARKANLNGQRAAEVRARLVAAGYAREHTVATGARGRSSIVVEPLPSASEVLNRQENGGTT